VPPAGAQLKSRGERWTTIVGAILILSPAAAFAVPVTVGRVPPARVPATTPGRARVTYLSGGSVYADAGLAEGLGVGDTVRIARGGEAIALARVAFASSHRVSCDTLQVSSPIRFGDEVSFRVRPSPASADSSVDVDASQPAPASAARSGSNRRIRGSLALRHLAWRQSAGNMTHQPAMDVRIERRDEHFDLALDLRTRRTFVIEDPAADDPSARLYRLSATLRPNPHQSFSVGRLQSPSLAPVSLFDGVLAQTTARAFTFGAFAGAQPNPQTWGFSGAVRQYGGFTEWRPALTGDRRASLALGGVSSYDHGQPSRDFAFLQGTFFARPWSLVGAQEVDLARAWKRERGDPTVGITSLYAMARYQPEPNWSLSAGYDGRRNVLLWRDRVTPETEFDDRFYQGTWVGAGYDPHPWLRLTSDARYRSGGDGALTLGGSVEVRHLGVPRVSLRTRGTMYDGEFTDSRLVTITAGIDAWSGVHIEAGGGLRETTEPATGFHEVGRWTQVDLDWVLASRWYALASWDHEADDLTDADRLMVGLRRSF
jgi:hypothetical protein